MTLRDQQSRGDRRSEGVSAASSCHDGGAVRVAVVRLVVVAVAGLVLVSGCSSGSSGAQHPDTTVSRNIGVTPSSTGATTATTSQVVSAGRQAVLTAYKTEEAAFLAVIETYPVNPNDPRLAATMTGARLTSVQRAFTVNRLEDEVGVGTTEEHSVVTSVTGSTAMITDCVFDHSRLIKHATGQTVSGPDTQTSLDMVTLEYVAGTWKVSGFETTGAGCVPTA